MKRIWTRLSQRWDLFARLVLILVTAMSLFAATSTLPADAARGPRPTPKRYDFKPSPVSLEQEWQRKTGRSLKANVPLHEPQNLRRTDLDRARAKAFSDSRVRKPVIDPDMKVLVISADGGEPDFPAIQAFLDQIGVPYDALIAKNTPLTAAMLSDGVSHGYYDAVILASGSLIYYDAGTNSYPSALTADQWQLLWSYEAQYQVRQVTSFTAPGFTNPDPYGLTYSGEGDTTTTPLTATLTAAGQQVFADLNPSSPITIKNAWAYYGTNPDATTTPLLTTSQGYVIASIHTYPDGRQNLAITVANNPYLLHSMLLSYGLINWATKGVFLGERHVNIGVQPDDLFIDDDAWDPATLTDTSGLTYRMSGTDYNRVVTWQAGVQASSPLTSTFRVEWPFNGEGTTGIYTPDTLTPAVQANPNVFNFISHTYTHPSLNPPLTSDQVATELTQNDQVATQFGFQNYSRLAFIQPDISGLDWDRLGVLKGPGTDPTQWDHDNPAFFLAAFNFGIRYVISDASRPNWSNPTPNAGYYSADQPSILIVPRRANNLFYNLTTPAQWVSEYNCYYGPTGTCANGTWRYWDHDFTYQEILDHESDNLLGYMLRWDLDPWMFHQPNFGLYDGTHSLLSDVLDMTFAKYQAAYNLPVRNLALREVGPKMADRMAYNASGVKGSVACPATGSGTMTISTVNPATIPVTGVAYGTNTETYGGQTISYITLAANQTVTIPAPASLCPTTDLSIANSDGLTSVAPGGALTYTIVATNSGSTAVNGATVTDTLPASLTGATWTCAASAGSTCASPSGTGSIAAAVVNLAANGTATFTLNATVAASPGGTTLANTATVAVPAGTTDSNAANNSATDTDSIVIPLPALTLLDNFSRANANTLGANWRQAVTRNAAAIRVNSNQAYAASAGKAVWNAAGSILGVNQGAAFTFANTPVNNTGTPPGLLLKASGGNATSPANYILVSYRAGQVTVATTTNSGGTRTTRGTLAATFASGNTLSAVASADGSVRVYKTAGASTTLIGTVAIPTSGTGSWPLGTGGGQIGLQLPSGSRVDSFSGGTLP